MAQISSHLAIVQPFPGPVVDFNFFKKAATAIVYQELVAGVLNTIAIQGNNGVVIFNQPTALGTDNIIFNLTSVYVGFLGGGMIYIEEADYNLEATWNVPVDVFVQGAGWNAVLNYDAGGNCITVTGDNVKIRDVKVVIVAGAGAGGTRPNCILADTRDNLEIFGVWLVGDETVADDASDVRQCGIVFSTVTFSRVSLCRIEDHRRNGISFVVASGNNTVTGNTCNGNTRQGILLNACLDNTVAGNICNGNAQTGIRLVSFCMDNTVTGNTCNGNTQNGIMLFSNVSDNTVTGNTCNENTLIGMLLIASTDNTVTGNTCNKNTEHGIKVDDAEENTLVGNTCNENDSGDTGSFDGINITDASLDNLIHSNTCNNNDRYGINIDDVNALRNWVKNNQLRGNTAGAFNDGGTDTKTPFIMVLAPNQDAYVGAALSNHRGQQCLDNVTTQVPFEIPIPNEFQEIVTAHVIYVTGANGIINRSVATDFGKVCAGEQIDAHSGAIAAGDIAGNTVDEFECDEISAALAGIAAGDWIGLTWTNFGAAAGTIDATVWVIGIRIRYV